MFGPVVCPVLPVPERDRFEHRVGQLGGVGAEGVDTKLVAAVDRAHGQVGEAAHGVKGRAGEPILGIDQPGTPPDVQEQ